MKTKIPTGWHVVKPSERKQFHDLELDKDKKWQHVTRFGDYSNLKEKKLIIRQDNPKEDLMMMLRQFPNYWRIQSGENDRIPHLMAAIMFYSGVEGFKYGPRWLAGIKEIENILPSNNSIEFYPYIELPVTNGRNIFWHLLDKAKFGFSGGASKEGKLGGYMQASFIDKNNFFLKIAQYFSIIQENFNSDGTKK